MKLRTLLFSLFFALASAGAGFAEFTAWQNTDYDFSKVRTVYLSDMVTSGAALTTATQE